MTRRSVLVFGASGQIGHFLLPRLRADGVRIFAVSRSPPRNDTTTWIRGDLFKTLDMLTPVDAICSAGPLDAFADWFERQPLEGVSRVVAFGSMSAQSKVDSIDPGERAVAARLNAAELQLQRVASARGIGWTIFRPTMIYGAGTDRTLARIAAFAARWRVLPIPFDAHGLRQPVHADDLAAACVAALDSARTLDKTYEVGGAERLRFDTMLRRVAATSATRVLAVPIPQFALRWMARLSLGALNAAAIRRLDIDLVADNSAAASDFGYTPRGFDASDVAPETQAVCAAD